MNVRKGNSEDVAPGLVRTGPDRSVHVGANLVFALLQTVFSIRRKGEPSGFGGQVGVRPLLNFGESYVIDDDHPLRSPVENQVNARNHGRIEVGHLIDEHG